MYKFILISGKAGAGKDTVARILNRKYGFKDYRYADNLKKVLLFAGWDGKKDLRGRKLLQHVGRAFRKWDQNFWVDKLMKDIVDDIDKGYDKFCIADVRHKNELYYFKDYMKKIVPDSKFVYIRVISSTNLFETREMDKETLADSSETDLDDVTPDYIIYNTVKDNYDFLESQLESLIKSEFGDEE